MDGRGLRTEEEEEEGGEEQSLLRPAPLQPISSPPAFASLQEGLSSARSHAHSHGGQPCNHSHGPASPHAVPRPINLLSSLKSMEETINAHAVPLFYGVFAVLYLVIFAVAMDLNPLSSVWDLLVGVVYHWCCVCCLVCYFHCHRGPGFVRQGWEQEYINPEEVPASAVTIMEEKSGAVDRWGRGRVETGLMGGQPMLGTNPSYCDKCKMSRPLRSHHCRRCGRCVLRLDHHCPWLAACVGFKNYRFFLQLLGYMMLTCVMSLGFIFARLLSSSSASAAASASAINQDNDSDSDQQDKILSGAGMLLLVVCAMCLLAVSALVAFQIRTQINLAGRNLTPVEVSEMLFEMDRADYFEMPLPNTHRWDHGLRANLLNIFGPTPLSWFVPDYIPMGDSTNGHYFRSSPSALQKLIPIQRAIQDKIDGDLKASGLMMRS